MPDRIHLCQASLKARPPKGDDWVYEIEWDDHRLSVHVEPTGVRILTRGGHDWTCRFPAIQQAALWLPVGTAILDGEAVVLDEQGRSDFGLLQQSLGGRGGRKSSSDAIFMAFDLLYFDGRDLRKSELDERRHLLEDLVPAGEQGDIRLSEEIEAGGDQLLASACDHGLEGIIAKRRSAPYRSRHLGDWVKIKWVQSESFVIVGHERSTAARAGIGRLCSLRARERSWSMWAELGPASTSGPLMSFVRSSTASSHLRRLPYKGGDISPASLACEAPRHHCRLHPPRCAQTVAV